MLAMSTPPDDIRFHRPYIRRRWLDADLADEADFLTREEKDKLRRYGPWLEALVTGELHPISRSQEEFVAAVKGSSDHGTEWSELWLKHVKARWGVLQRQLDHLRISSRAVGLKADEAATIECQIKDWEAAIAQMRSGSLWRLTPPSVRAVREMLARNWE